MYRVALTGHRPKDIARFCQGQNPYDLHNRFWMSAMNTMLAHVAELLSQHPEGLELHSGMALGADTAWAGVIVIARKRFGADKIRFVADCPLPTQASRWPAQSQATWQKLVSLADDVRYTTTGPYYKACMEERNQQMINPSDECIAFWSGSTAGGTANGVRDAMNAGCRIYRIDPADPSSGRYIYWTDPADPSTGRYDPSTGRYL